MCGCERERDKARKCSQENKVRSRRGQVVRIFRDKELRERRKKKISQREKENKSERENEKEIVDLLWPD